MPEHFPRQIKSTEPVLYEHSFMSDTLKAEIDKRSEVGKALRLAEALDGAIVNTKALPVCCFPPHATLTFVNEAYCNFLGKTAAELVDQSLLTFIPKVESHEFIRETIWWIVEPRGGLHLESEALDQNYRRGAK